MKLRYTVDGCGANSAEFSIVGEIDGGNPIDPQSQQLAASAAFHTLTSGMATYGRPGEGGCRGPYKITRFVLEVAP